MNYLENVGKLKVADTIFNEKPRESPDFTRANMVPRPIPKYVSYHASLDDIKSVPEPPR